MHWRNKATRISLTMTALLGMGAVGSIASPAYAGPICNETVAIDRYTFDDDPHWEWSQDVPVKNLSPFTLSGGLKVTESRTYDTTGSAEVGFSAEGLIVEMNIKFGLSISHGGSTSKEESWGVSAPPWTEGLVRVGVIRQGITIFTKTVYDSCEVVSGVGHATVYGNAIYAIGKNVTPGAPPTDFANDILFHGGSAFQMSSSQSSGMAQNGFKAQAATTSTVDVPLSGWSFSRSSTYPGYNHPPSGGAAQLTGDISGTLGDFNGDGRRDVITVDTGNNLYVNTGDGYGVSSRYWADNFFGDGVTTVNVADWNGDGRSDVITTDTGNNLYVYTGNGYGVNQRFWAGNFFLSGIKTVNVADWTGDGLADIITTDTGNNLYVYPGNGYGFGTRFWAGDFFTSGIKTVNIADWTGDGKADIITTDAGNNLYVYPGNGYGFSAKYWAGDFFMSGVKNLMVGDWTGDGKTDIVTTDTGNNLYVYPGNGYGFGAKFWASNFFLSGVHTTN